MSLLTAILGGFFGVGNASGYDSANAEFWCRNCPNDYRKNCPFIPTDSGGQPISNSNVCNCPGGTVSQPGQAFWATVGDSSLAADYIQCSDKTLVYQAWIAALFPEFTLEQVSHAAGTFNNRCLQNRASVGYILVIGPALTIIAGILCMLSLHSAFANTPIPVAGFEVAMLAVALELISFWPLSFTGAAGLISRYTLCSGYSYPVVLNATSTTARTGPRAAPVFYNGSPCYDLNSEGSSSPNPFVQQLGVFNAGYVSGGVLVIISLICMLAVVSKHTDVIFELKLAGQLGPAAAAAKEKGKP